MRTCGIRSDSAAAAGRSDRLFGNPCFYFFGSRRLAWADLRKRCVKMLLSLRFRGGGGQVRPTFRKSVFLFFRFP